MEGIFILDHPLAGIMLGHGGGPVAVKTQIALPSHENRGNNQSSQDNTNAQEEYPGLIPDQEPGKKHQKMRFEQDGDTQQKTGENLFLIDQIKNAHGQHKKEQQIYVAQFQFTVEMQHGDEETEKK